MVVTPDWGCSFFDTCQVGEQPNHINACNVFLAQQIRIYVVLPVYLTYPYQPVGKIKKQTAARRQHAGRTSIRDFIVMLKLRQHVASQRIQDFLEDFFFIFSII